MLETCPLCLKFLSKETKKQKAMLMAYSCEFFVYSCVQCQYIIDFTVQDDIRSMTMSAAFRRMVADLNSIHKGETVSEEMLNMYRNFIDSQEFKSYSKLWDEKNVSFWNENKHLLIHLV